MQKFSKKVATLEKVLTPGMDNSEIPGEVVQMMVKWIVNSGVGYQKI